MMELIDGLAKELGNDLRRPFSVMSCDVADADIATPPVRVTYFVARAPT